MSLNWFWVLNFICKCIFSAIISMVHYEVLLISGSPSAGRAKPVRRNKYGDVINDDQE